MNNTRNSILPCDTDATRIGTQVLDLLNKVLFFKEYRFHFTAVPKHNSLFLRFQLINDTTPPIRLSGLSNMNDDEDVYCTVRLMKKTTSCPYTEMNITYVNSTMGYGTGVFIMYIQLLVGFLCGVKEITLENYTNNQIRAATGIYKLFTVNIRGHSRNNFKGKTLGERLHESEGKMRLVIESDFLDKWIYTLIHLDKKAEKANTTNPWSAGYSANLRSFIRYLRQIFPHPFTIPDINKNLPAIQYTKKNKPPTNSRKRTKHFNAIGGDKRTRKHK